MIGGCRQHEVQLRSHYLTLDPTLSQFLEQMIILTLVDFGLRRNWWSVSHGTNGISSILHAYLVRLRAEYVITNQIAIVE